jgi:hypothetical protein
MGTVTFGVDAGAGGAATKVFTVSNANLGRLVAWSKANLFQPLPGSLPPNPTNAEAIEAWAQFMMDHSRAVILNYERQTAALGPIEAT